LSECFLFMNDDFFLASPTPMEYFIDPKTGMLRKNADLYDLTAKIANKTGKGNGITGDDIIEQVYSGKGKAYIEPVDIVGSRHGGWIDVKSIVKELKLILLMLLGNSFECGSNVMIKD